MQHINELNIVTIQLSSVGIEFDDEVRALILLSSLPDSWSATVTAVSSSSGSKKMKFDDVRDLFSVKRSDGESWVNLHLIQYRIQSQEEEIQPKEMDVVNQRPDDPNPKIIVVLTT